jgi:hypothetical protein
LNLLVLRLFIILEVFMSLSIQRRKLMLRKSSFTLLALGAGVLIGVAFSRIPTPQTVSAQGVEQILVQGHGRANSSTKPPAAEQFTLSASNASRASFKVVPAGKKFVLTDVMYIAQRSVRQGVVVNIAKASADTQTQDILFQVKLEPGESDKVSLCSGYVIPAGKALVAFTNANLEPEQYVSVAVTGYLIDG